MAGLSEPQQVKWSFELAYPVIFANGADRQVIKVFIKDQQDQEPLVKPQDLKVYTDVQIKDLKVLKDKNDLIITFRPLLKSPDFNLRVKWKEELGPPVLIKTTLLPLKDKLKPIKSNYSSGSHIENIDFTFKENFYPGLFEGFEIYNNGKNRIVSKVDSQRWYDFEYPEQGRQNISFLVNDAPNGTVSHTMHSHFMLFPRLILPLIEFKKDRYEVTLTTGEQVIFNQDGEITEGVFTEGPVDIGPDRHTRKYADLKYQGQGIILRANARGLSPQQGQFENTPIDMDYGLKFSKDVLILNGKTGERCRRPKTDFWPQGDFNPIEFKFPTDEEFNRYLRENCKFEIPELPVPQKNKKPQAPDEVDEIWSKCEATFEINKCLASELERFQGSDLLSVLEYELALKSSGAFQTEKLKAKDQIAEALNNLFSDLSKDLSFVKNIDDQNLFQSDCLIEARAKFKNPLRFSNPWGELEAEVRTLCSDLKKEVDQIVNLKIKNLQQHLIQDLSWLQLDQDLKSICLKRSQDYLDQIRHSNLKLDSLNNRVIGVCDDFSKSDTFKNWLTTQRPLVVSQVVSKALTLLEPQGIEVINSCLRDFPGNSQLERLKLKPDREACLNRKWREMEYRLVAIVLGDSKSISLKIEVQEVLERIDLESKRTKLRLMKKHL
jgi:hypothetical protein